MGSLTPLDEDVATGDGGHAELHAEVNRRLNRVAERVGLAAVEDAETSTLLSAQVTGDLLPRFQVRADGTIAMGGAPLDIVDVSGTTTVTVTTAADHGYGTGDVVTISGVAGHVGANGTWTITRTGATTFTLNGAVGSGSYTSGGTVQRLLGTSGSANEGVWNLVVPEADNSRYGLLIRLNSTSMRAGFVVADHQAAPIFVVMPAGGAGVISADTADGLWTSEDTFGRSAFLNTAGGLRLVYGDPAGGVDVLALGDATAEPDSIPDGSHTAEHGHATEPGIVLWSRDGRPRYLTSAGHADELAAPLHRRYAQISAPGPGGGTTLVASGVASLTVETTGITAAADDTAAGPGVSYTTTAAAGVTAGVTAVGVAQARWAPALYCRLATDASAITDTRLAVGMVSAEIAGDAGPASSGGYTVASGFWLRYDSGVDGTAFWRAVTSDGTDATVTTTTAAIAADTSYELLMEVNSTATAVRFWVDGTLVATHTTTLPAAATPLGVVVRLQTLGAAARALRFGRLAWTIR